jgi:5-(carboxyamino)imidazole ribonucleotide mutase
MSENAKPLVGIVMGSANDWDVMVRAHDMLDELGIAHECRVLSAHRTPDELVAWLKDVEERGAEVFIAGAGVAAALPGVVAAYSLRPVLGVPVDSGPLRGEDALHAIVQMPPGIPVGTLAIGKAGATNAALLAAAILANKYPELTGKIASYRKAQAAKVLSAKVPPEV